MSPLIVGLVCGIDIMICATIVRSVLGQFYQDGSWPRLFILLAVPFQFVVTLFFCNMVISVIMQLFGPVKQVSLHVLVSLASVFPRLHYPPKPLLPPSSRLFLGLLLILMLRLHLLKIVFDPLRP